MKLSFLLLALLLIPGVYAFSQDAKTTEDEEAAYTRTINSRAEKIVTTLGIADAAKAARVQQIIAAQYRNLNEIHTQRDEQIKAAKAKGGDKAALEAQIKGFEEMANARLKKLHDAYAAKLSVELSPEQIVKVKDGMTYNVAPNTYRAYQDMIPTLTAEQKAQILAWLEEAREYAMDAETSEKKHGWFGKYKGRINNYLSAAGYDLKKEGEAWEKRRAAAKAASPAN